MRNYFFIVFFLLFCVYSQGQNLILNPSLEDYSLCPDFQNQLYYADYWYSPGSPLGHPTTPLPLQEISPDYFNVCSTEDFTEVPNAEAGFQYPFDGYAYAGFLTYFPDGNNLREYATATIITPLVKNGIYCFSFYASVGDFARFSIDNIGAYFTVDSIYSTTFIDVPNPQIMSPDNVFLSDTANWMLVSGEFVAEGGEKFVTIGNFKNDANTSKFVSNPTVTGGSYYYIDMLSLIKCGHVGVEENPLEKIKIYPNPAQDFVTIETPNYNTQTQLSIYSLTGQLISQKQITRADQNIAITELGNGMYIFIVQSGDRVIGRQRVVISE
jgi:OmpA-OmpF porin, OOP family